MILWSVYIQIYTILLRFTMSLKRGGVKGASDRGSFTPFKNFYHYRFKEKDGLWVSNLQDRSGSLL